MLGASLVLPSRASSAIRECSSIQDVIGEVRPGTLVVFDIDNTILRPAQVLGSDEWFHYYLMKMKLEMADQSQAFIQAVDLLHSIYFVTQVKAMEECTADVLHSLQNKGVTMMGLTSRSPPVANISIRHLKSLGIDMNLTAPTHACFSLIDIPETLFFQGVLFTNGKSKKNALSAFFKQISWKPKKIVFIDDDADVGVGAQTGVIGPQVSAFFDRFRNRQCDAANLIIRNHKLLEKVLVGILKNFLIRRIAP